jgi:festuclavine dehydrogenase
VAQIISETIDKPMKHENLSVADLEAKFLSSGMPQEYATMLAGLDDQISKGLEAQLDDDVLKVTGRPPKSFRTFARDNRNSWL